MACKTFLRAATAAGALALAASGAQAATATDATFELQAEFEESGFFIFQGHDIWGKLIW